MNLMKSADLLIDKIKNDYKEDVSLVVVMGSYIYKDTHSRSDLDMYFVPKTKRGENLGKVFIIDGIGFDYWPISWERLERIANYEERITSIVTEGKVLYYGSKEDLARFERLRNQGRDLNNRKDFIEKSKEQFQKSYQSYFNLLLAESLRGVRKYGLEIIFSVTYATALLNQRAIKRGRGKLKEEILKMDLVPEDFSLLYDRIFFSKDIAEIKNTLGQLMMNMKNLLAKEELKEEKGKSFQEQLEGYYEELINFYNKIHRACEVGDVYTALFAAVEIHQEIEGAFLGTDVSPQDLPDMLEAFDPDDLEVFLDTAVDHQGKLFDLLKRKRVSIEVFDDFFELKEYLDSL